MKWHSLRGTFAECPDPPYLLSSDGPGVVTKLSGLGLELSTVTVAASDREKDLLRRFGEALGFPAQFHANWDAFYDLVSEFVTTPGRTVAVNVLGADDLARADLRRFVRVVWMLMKPTESVELGGAGSAQLEFLFRGRWDAGTASGQ